MSALSIATDGYFSNDYKTLSIATSGYLDVLTIEPPITPTEKTSSGGIMGIKVKNQRIFNNTEKISNSKKHKNLYIEDDEVLNILKMFLHCQPQ